MKVSGSKNVTKIMTPGLVILMTVISSIFIVFYSYILKYVNDLKVKKCECSENWKRDYIKYFSMAAIGFIVFNLILQYVQLKLKLPDGMKLFTNVLSIVYNILFVIFLGVLFVYTRNLYKIKCECSDDKMRTITHYFSATIGGLYLLMIVLIIIGTILAKLISK